MGFDRIVKTAHNMGIKSRLDPTPSLTLGASDVTLLELTNAYCTPVNDGKAHGPVLVTRILDRDGNEIYTAATEDRQVMSGRSAFLVQQLLTGGMSGTSSRLMGFVGRHATDTDFGGKTGTSNNHSDAWFIGTTPRLVCGAWVGGEYRCIHFRTGQLGQGNRTALPICGYFLESVLGDPAFKHYHAKFTVPKDEALAASMYNCGGYFRAPSDSDSLSVDSLGLSQEIMLDEFGNEAPMPKEHQEEGAPQPQPDEPQVAVEPKNED